MKVRLFLTFETDSCQFSNKGHIVWSPHPMSDRVSNDRKHPDTCGGLVYLAFWAKQLKCCLTWKSSQLHSNVSHPSCGCSIGAAGVASWDKAAAAVSAAAAVQSSLFTRIYFWQQHRLEKTYKHKGKQKKTIRFLFFYSVIEVMRPMLRMTVWIYRHRHACLWPWPFLMRSASPEPPIHQRGFWFFFSIL